MANYGTTLRPVTNSSPSTLSPDHHHQDGDSTGKKRLNGFKIVFPFSIPETPEGAATRIIRNLALYGWYYTILIWIVLFVTLIPRCKVSLFYLMGMTNITCFYLLFLKSFPDLSSLLHRIIDRRFVLVLLFIVTAVVLIVTKAGLHLLLTLACGIPIVLVHAVFWIREDDFGVEEGCSGGELLALVSDKSKEPDSDMV